ncbi:hypothetical protein [Streptomyces regalis]|uniref:hypothetical protein n=1 Tax=Streptomyces regalis TaxID=68262 RepID=UPI000A56ABC5|nr:hypothetical protein [Streptomyces regalis]
MTSTTSVHHLTEDDGRRRQITPEGATGAGRAFAWMLIVSGALGILASFVITTDSGWRLGRTRRRPTGGRDASRGRHGSRDRRRPPKRLLAGWPM